MAKQGMKRPEISSRDQKNTQPPVPELQGKAKHTKKPARPVPEGDAAIWKDVTKSLKSTRMQLFSALRSCAFRGFDGDTALITFEESNEIFFSICLRDENRAVIEKAFSDVCQRPITVQLTLNRADTAAPHSSIDEGTLFDAFGRQNVDIMD